jgi:cob(I)alamin adenosyltransferase
MNDEQAPSGAGFLYTRAGDGGDTGLLGGERVPKWDLQPEAYGALDEASSALGLARALAAQPETKDSLLRAQRRLYQIMAELATGRGVEVDPAFRTTDEHVRELEAETDGFGARITLGREFVLPGETVAGGALDLARTIVRRAEREVARLAHERGIGGGATLAYLNRLSSLLFVLARFDEQAQGRTARSARQDGTAKRSVRRKR